MYVKAHVANAKKGLQQVRDETQHLSQGFGALKQAGAMAAGMLLRDMVNSATAAIGEIARLGGQISTLERSFERLADAAIGEVSSLNALRKATKETVADVDLLRAANQALMLGLPTENLDQLFGSAIKLGRAMGIDAKAAVDSLTIGIGRQSRLVLDNLGVIVKAEQAYEWYAQQLGKTSDALSEAEKREGWMAYAIKQVTDKAETLGDVTSEVTLTQERWAASIKNLKTKIGEMLGPLGGFASQAELIIQPLSTMAAVTIPSYITACGGLQAAIWGVVAALKAKIAAAYSALAALGPAGWALIAGAVATTGAAIYLMTRRIDEAAGSTEALNKEMEDTLQTLNDYTRAIETLTSKQATELKTIDQRISKLLDEREQLQATLTQEDRYSQGIEATRQQIEKIDKEIEELTESRQDHIDTINDEILALKKEKEALEETLEVTKQITKFQELINRLKDDFNLLQAETASNLDAIAEHFDRVFSEGRFKDAAWMIKAFASVWDISWSEAEKILRDRAEAIKDTIEEIPKTVNESLYDKAQGILEKFRKCSTDKLLDLEDTFESAKERLRESIFEPGGQTASQIAEYKSRLAELEAAYATARTEISSVQAARPGGLGASMTSTSVSVTAPLVNIEGSADEKTARRAADIVKKWLKSVVIENTSSQAVTSRIRLPR